MIELHCSPMAQSCSLILSGRLRGTAKMVSSRVYLVSLELPHETSSRAREVVAPVRPISFCTNSRPLGAPSRSALARLKISGLRRGDRREQCPVRLEVDQRGAIEAVKPADQQHQAIPRNQRGNSCTDWIWPYRRAQRESAAGGAVICRTLTHEIPPRLMEPIEYFDSFEVIDSIEGISPAFANLDPADRSIGTSLSRTFKT
jgi:hypothetical protein